VICCDHPAVVPKLVARVGDAGTLPYEATLLNRSKPWLNRNLKDLFVGRLNDAYGMEQGIIQIVENDVKDAQGHPVAGQASGDLDRA
jgi:hypothetical protein